MGSEIWEVNEVKEEGLPSLSAWKGNPSFLARCSSGQKLPESLCCSSIREQDGSFGQNQEQSPHLVLPPAHLGLLWYSLHFSQLLALLSAT